MATQPLADLHAIKDLGWIPAEDVDALNDERPTMIPRLIGAASGRFLSYWRKQYKAPVPDPIPDEITWFVVSVVVHQLVFGKRGVNVTDDIASEVKAEYERAIEWLKDLADGNAELAVDADSTPDKDEGGPSLGNMAGPYKFINDVQEQQAFGYGGPDGCGCG